MYGQPLSTGCEFLTINSGISCYWREADTETMTGVLGSELYSEKRRLPQSAAAPRDQRELSGQDHLVVDRFIRRTP